MKSLYKLYILLIIFCFIFISSKQYVYALYVDSIFGTDGIVNTQVLPLNPIGNKIIVQNGDKILVSGHTSNGNYNIWKISRFTKEGIIDTTFGINGSIIEDFGYSATIDGGIAIQSDNKIIATGSNTINDTGRVLISRYNSDGARDTTFGNNGSVQISVPNSQIVWVNDIKIQNDGKIIIVGEEGNYSQTYAFIMRVNTDGTTDNSFGVNGINVINNPSVQYNRIRSLALTPDDKILTIGSLGGMSLGGDPISVYRFNIDGSLDTAFGDGGYIMDHFGLVHDFPTDIEIQNDGKIIITGITYGHYAINPTTFVVRYLSDGKRDTSFASNGLYINMFNSSDNQANSLRLQEDGKIIIAGAQYDGSKYVPVLRRLFSNGILDESFGENGSYLIPTERSSIVYSLTKLSDGELIAGLSDGNMEWQLKKIQFTVVTPTVIPTTIPTVQPTPTATPLPTLIPTIYPTPNSVIKNNTVTIDDSKDREDSNGNDKWVYFGTEWSHCGQNNMMNPCSLKTHNNTLSWTNDSDSSANVFFTGRKIKLFGVRNELSGIIEIIVDNSEKQIVNTYSPNIIESTMLWESEYLSTGKHVIKIQISGNDNKSSILMLDKVEVVKSNSTK